MKVALECGGRLFSFYSWTKVVEHPWKTKVVKTPGADARAVPINRRVLDVKPRKFPGGFAIGPVMFFIGRGDVSR